MLLTLVWLAFLSAPALARAQSPEFPDVDQSMPAYDAIG